MIESLTYWAAFTSIALALVASLAAVVFQNARAGQAGRLMEWLALAALTVSIAIRWRTVGHPPIFGSYENSLAAVWFLLVMIQTGRLRLPAIRHLGLVGLPWCLAILLWGVRFNRHHIPLTISERSLWVDAHAVFAWFAYVALSLAAGLSVAYFVRLRREAGGREPGWTAAFPEAAVLDDVVMRYLTFGFLNLTVMMATGLWYSWLLVGKWWQWDLVETTTLVSWLLYALVIHLKLFFGWKGGRLHAISVLALAALLFAFWGMTYFGGISYHVFDLGF